MICPNCQTKNENVAKFCFRCGYSLQQAAQSSPAQNYPAWQPPPVAPSNQTSPYPQAQNYPPMSNQQAPIAQGGAPLAQSGAPMPPVAPALYPPPAYRPPGGAQATGYGTTGFSTFNMWGPFAGYGTRRRHTGWLMDNQGHRAAELVEAMDRLFKERQIPKVQAERKELVARGVAVETRPYFILKRELASIALYIMQFGRDLFISQASYLKPPVSPLKLVILGCSVVFQLFMMGSYSKMLSDSVSGLFGGFGLLGGTATGGGGDLGFLLCVIGPVGLVNTIALIIFTFYSFYKFVTEKDLLAGLRVNPNEFNEDDLMAMEKAVEQTVRIALTDLKLNPDELQPTSLERGGQLF